MSDRIEIGANGSIQDFTGKGSGEKGQIKKASWLGKEFSIQSGDRTIAVNRGSLIDYLNAQNSEGTPLKKGFLCRFGGSSNDDISKVFEQVISHKKFTFGETEKANALKLEETERANALKLIPLSEKKLAMLPFTSDPSSLTNGDACFTKDTATPLFANNYNRPVHEDEYFEVFSGATLIAKKSGEGMETILHICPGGTRPAESQEQFDEYMKLIYQMLVRYKENPEKICIHTNNDKHLEYLNNWQNKNL